MLPWLWQAYAIFSVLIVLYALYIRRGQLESSFFRELCRDMRNRLSLMR